MPKAKCDSCGKVLDYDHPDYSMKLTEIGVLTACSKECAEKLDKK